MENCLVTKLKGSVDNNTLLKMEEINIQISILPENERYGHIGLPYGTGLRVLNGTGGFYLSTDTERTTVLTEYTPASDSPANLYAIPIAGNYTLAYKFPYSGINIIDINGEKELDLNGIGVAVDPTFLKYRNPFVTIDFHHVTLTKEIDIMDIPINGGDVWNFNCGKTTIKGNINEKFDGNTHIHSIYFNDCKNITGNLNQMLDSMYNAGKHSDTMFITVDNSKVVFTSPATGTGTVTFTENGWHY